jgi:hypothetical protein
LKERTENCDEEHHTNHRRRDELAAIYAQLSAEWRTAGIATRPERMWFKREDIIEHRKLTAHELLTLTAR